MLRLLLIRRPQLGDVALDRLAFERFAFGFPTVERAGFEVEVQRLAVRADRDDARVAQRFVERISFAFSWPAGDAVAAMRMNAAERQRVRSHAERGNEAERRRWLTAAAFAKGYRWQDLPIVSHRRAVSIRTGNLRSIGLSAGDFEERR